MTHYHLVLSPKTAMSNPRAACGPVEGFVRPSLDVAVVKVSHILTTCPYFNNFKFDILTQVVLSAALSRLLPVQLGFECFLYISLS